VTGGLRGGRGIFPPTGARIPLSTAPFLNVRKEKEGRKERKEERRRGVNLRRGIVLGVELGYGHKEECVTNAQNVCEPVFWFGLFYAGNSIKRYI